MTATRLGQPLTACGVELQPNAERHLRTRLRLAQTYPADLLAETLNVAARCSFSMDELRYHNPADVIPAGETPASYLRRITYEGAGRHPGQGAGPDRARARTDQRPEVRALLPDGGRHRAVRPLAADPLPGARVGGEFSGLLLRRRHRGRSGARWLATTAPSASP